MDNGELCDCFEFTEVRDSYLEESSDSDEE